MKDKTITYAHFDFANDQIKILGFKNLSDFETKIQYTKLKSEQKYICNKINLSVELFKKIFPQEGFDLRKINYSFDNIDQVLGFIKKLFGFLSIQYNYSRIKGIPTLRLIQPNNLYNNYIMNLRNIPQNVFSIISAENDEKNIQKSQNLCNEQTFEKSNEKSDFFTIDLVRTNENKYKEINGIDFTNIITNDDAKYKIIKSTELFDKFEKKEISSSYITGNKLNLSIIPIDWINTINISISENTNNTNNTNNNCNTKCYNQLFTKLPLGTTISLIIGDDEIILHKIDIDEQKKLEENNHKLIINFPNNFLYEFTVVNLQINLPGNFNKLDNDLYENLTDNKIFLFEYTGWIIDNKNILSNFTNNIIKFDSNKLLSYFNLGIYNCQLKIQIEKYYNSMNNNKNISINQFNQSSQLNQSSQFNQSSKFNQSSQFTQSPMNYSMSYLINYLKKSFEKKYIINDTLCLKTINIFEYFNWIKIKTLDKNKLNPDTIIELKLGNNVILSNVITTNTIFDDDNYYKFEIEFPNSILYKYDSIDLKIILSKNDILNENNNLFDIIICGSNFKISTPKMFFSTDAIICFNHNYNWYIQGKKEFISRCGMINNRFHFDKKFMEEDEITTLFKEFQKNKLVTINTIELNSEIKDTCVFVEIDFENDKIIKSKQKCTGPIFFLISNFLNKYLRENNLLKNTNSFSFGSNKFIGSINYNLCELINISTCKMYYEISKSSDLIKHFDIEFIELKKKLNSKNNHGEYLLDLNAWIEHDLKKIYDFGKLSFILSNKNNKIRLNCNNKYVSLIDLQNIIFLVIEIPLEKLKDWNKISMSIGSIYSNSSTKRNLSQYGISTVNVID